MKILNKNTLALAISSLAFSSSAFAEDNTIELQGSDMSIEEVIVHGEIGYRNRVDTIEQVLEYDRGYFERFEPSSAGDALKRVPSVTFLSDVTESDGARLRGLNPGYTQILINGEAVPGIGQDRSFLLDRIPAELIERVEVIRSNSADRPGDALAGAVNIILRDSYSLDGAYVKLGGAIYSEEEEVKESLAAVWGGELAGGRAVIGVNRQGRLNPKQKNSLRYSDSPENNANFATEEFDNREDQSDVRDSTDTSLNFNYQKMLMDGSELKFDGVYVDTDRTEKERSFEYDNPTATTGPVNEGGNLLTDNQQLQDIEQSNASFNVAYSFSMLDGTSEVKAGFAQFESTNDNRESEIDFEDAQSVIEDERELEVFEDEEINISFSHERSLNEMLTLKAGIDLRSKTRDTSIKAGDNERDITTSGWDQFASNSPLSVANSIDDLEAIDGGLNSIEEDRMDIYALLEGEVGALQWETGVRFEKTDTSIEDKNLDQTVDNDYSQVLPSLHIRYAVTDSDRIMLSLAQSVRRPDFNYLTPATLEGEFEDNDLRGNPNLEPERATGLDLGYEHRIGRKGVMGINFFYRDVSDKIELANTQEDSVTAIEDNEPGTFVYEPQNIGDGTVQGVEVDLSMPLSILALDNTGIFVNYSYIDSEVEDELGKRAFNDQPEWVYNLGFIQDLPNIAASFGATYREQGDAYGRFIAEEITTSYGPDLEIFIEKRWPSMTLRFVGSNLLDSSKDESFNKFETIADQQSRSFDEYELETEEAGPVYRLSLRMAL
ncbi:TonB-dependent receptor [Bermanella marisrubri]|uniref:TonB-dependent receptor n=1 Tax=Bermanella marisrubri TaxID=207949 RepID=Q1N3F9_9GAMM|nr:TonB-dependent receptor [Bermanella marisrubri]EAT12632.1 TonB-dependent receptor [Oceanobacter sp. RED65] [Bermanella marisrubri]QIZ85241.1 TonB-dependent receptor [Bermanella marisrubri]